MRKKVCFSEIVFTNEYYICGVNVLDENEVEYVETIAIDLEVNLSFSKIDNAKVYRIKESNIKIVISEIRDFKIVSYLNNILFHKICSHPRHTESLHKNYSLLEELVIQKLRDLPNDELIVYSPDYKTRAIISKDNKTIQLKYQRLEIEDEIAFYFYDDITSDNFWTWEDLAGVSYFDSVENAKKEAQVYLQNYISEPNRYYEKPYVSLWEYQLTRGQTWLYMMKFAIVGPVLIMMLSCLLPIFGQSNWNILWLSGGCCLFALVLGGILTWKNYLPISYEITDKGIIASKGMYYETSYNNIRSVKIKKNLFNKNKGSIKFKLKKGSSINYNFDNIENVEEAYKIIKEKIDKTNED